MTGVCYHSWLPWISFSHNNGARGCGPILWNRYLHRLSWTPALPNTVPSSLALACPHSPQPASPTPHGSEGAHQHLNHSVPLLLRIPQGSHLKASMSQWDTIVAAPGIRCAHSCAHLFLIPCDPGEAGLATHPQWEPKPGVSPRGPYACLPACLSSALSLERRVQQGLSSSALGWGQGV